MKRLLAMMLKPLSPRERGRGEGTDPDQCHATFVPSPDASRHPLPKGEGRSYRRLWRYTIVIALLALTVCVTPAAFAIDPLPFQSTAQRDRFQHLTRELRCMVCQDESLLASNADFAKQLRRQIFDMMQQGKSDKEIKVWLVARYSNFILYDPPLQTSTLALWFGTPAILLVGGIVVVVLLRRRTRPAHTITEDPGEDW